MVRGFSSLGAPSLRLVELRRLARSFSLDFIELRAVDSSTDLPGLLAQGALADLATDALPVRLVASDLRLLEAGPAEIEAFSRYAAVADHLCAPCVRVFGGGAVGQELADGDLDRVAGQLESLPGGDEETRCPLQRSSLETHFAFSSARMCRSLNRRLSGPVLLLWDSHHTWRRGHETPEDAWALICPLVRHIHYKDSRMHSSSGIDGC